MEDGMHCDLDAGESLINEEKMSDELSAAFYAAASAVSRFKMQCMLEEKRHKANGYKKMVEAIVSEIKAKANSGLVSVSDLLSFLRRQLQHLPTTHEASGDGGSESKPAAGDRLDLQASRFQTAAAALAEMQIHTRQAQRRNVGLGGRLAAEFVARNVLPLDGQSIQEAALLDFLDKQCTTEQVGVGTDQQHGEVDLGLASALAAAKLDSRRPAVSAGVAGAGGASGMMPPTPPSRKRSYSESVTISLDPVFEQAFKRQCQLPPTPPRPLLLAKHPDQM